MKDDINQIIANELTNQSDDKDKAALLRWLKKNRKNPKEFNILRLDWVQGNTTLDDSKERVLNRLRKNLTDTQIPTYAIDNSKGIQIPLWLKVAAVLLLVGTLTLLFYQNRQFEIPENEAISMIVKDNPKGMKRQVVLPDGSRVWLNSNSKLSYPSQFNNDSRIVELNGEAYFEVQKDKKRPFNVTTGELTTIVLGTTFNINSFENNEETHISLIEGKVKVKRSSTDDEVILSPGSEAVYDKAHETFNVRSFDPEWVLSWKNGVIIFKDTKETQVWKKLENWYGVTFKFENDNPKEWRITSKFEDESLEEVLRILGDKMQFDYTIDNKIVTIKYLKDEI